MGGWRALACPGSTSRITHRPRAHTQVVSTAFLMAFLCSIVDKRNNSVPSGAVPALAGCCVICIGVCFGYNSGFPINPARDFAPRLFVSIAGWGSGVWSATHHWWWVPIVAPPIGAATGAAVYHGMIERWHDRPPAPS